MYTLKSYNDTRFIFTLSKFTSILYWIMLILATPALLLGLISVSVSPDEMGLFLAGFGLVFLMGALMLKKTKEYYPKEIIFDNKEALMKLLRGKKSTAIPYADLAAFESVFIREKGHIVYVKRKDGSILDLVSFGSSFTKKDKELLELLNSRIDLNQESAYPVAQPQWLERLDRTPDIIYYWKEKQSFKMLIMFILVLVGFALSIGVSSVYIFYLFIGVSILLVGYSIFSYIRSKTNYALLKISPDKVQFGYAKNVEDCTSHLWQAKKEITRMDLADSRYSMDTSGGDYLAIMLLKEDEMEMLDSIRDGSYNFSQIASILKKNLSLFRIRPAGRSILDIIDFERILKKDLFPHKYR